MKGHQISLFEEIIVDNFAGGGGASTGIELALGRPVDIAINHAPAAIAMHQVNHKFTEHYCESVWDINPKEICRGRKVALMWLSPDCKHFSKAKGGKPVEKNIRGLAWIALRWASTVKPRVIILENVEEFKTWGRIDKLTGKPNPKHKGETFRSFVNALKYHGYEVDYKELRACDYGAPTSRKRFVMVARCDGQQIKFPKPTHAPVEIAKEKGLLTYKSAADIIDWSISCPSIFERKKPLVSATMRRIARGLDKFVIKNNKPFLIPIGYGERKGQNPRVQDIDNPLSTVVSSCKQYLVKPQIAPFIEQANFQNMPVSVNKPLTTTTTVNHHRLVETKIAPFIEKGFGGNYNGAGASVENPLPTITTVDHNSIATAYIHKYYAGNYNGAGSAINAPLDTVTVEERHSIVKPTLTKFNTYQNLGYWHQIREMLNTYLGYNLKKDEILLFKINGQDYFIYDIGMRMLTPRELYNAQGFPVDYQIEFDFNGKKYSKKEQIARCGNAVCPPMAEAVVKANLPEYAANIKIETMSRLKKIMVA